MTSTLDLRGEDFLGDPQGVLRGLREADWFAETAMGPAILRYDEVRALLSSWSLRTPGVDFLAAQGITDGPVVEAVRGFLLSADGDDHQRVRRSVGKAFTVRRVEDFRCLAGDLADELVAGLGKRAGQGAGTTRNEGPGSGLGSGPGNGPGGGPGSGVESGGGFDFVEGFAQPFALGALCRFVGIPEDVRREVGEWTADVGLVFGLGVAEHVPRIEAALENLHGFIDDLLDQRRRSPQDDLLSALVDQSLTEAELRSLVITLLSAGHGSVRHQLGNAMAAFLAHPDQWRLLAADPSLAEQAAEEVVRHSPSALLGLPRVVKEDIRVNGTTFAAGSWVLPVTGSANRDAAVYDEPDRLDITVARTAHLTYGGGIHYCLGAALARVELQEALPRLAAAMPDVRADGPAKWLPPNEVGYGPLSLPLRTP
ncbi:cytochrome P450 [Umezawaea tangerina]|uniref:Cytochrome P450 n=1 Tax=Umezawaea tangerina TaxID=84725 RepID=A0A2T0T584_9PSEU|nr:cytochrome P450 [Umezawaea tangerina]PRY40791.1 cytochrome P450 [Umezawaea tangerina]